MKWLVIVLVPIMLVVGLAGSAFAEDQEGKWINSNHYGPNGVLLSMDKLGRGLVNTAFGVIEIPKQCVKRPIDTGHSSGYVSGFFIGIGYFILRELAGVYEIVTFPIPIPAGYEPVIDPLLGYKPHIPLQ
jgi:putative exosortase-associated protein (TIGR04073 family)